MNDRSWKEGEIDRETMTLDGEKLLPRDKTLTGGQDQKRGG